LNLISSIVEGALGLRADATGSPAPWDDVWYNNGLAYGSSSSAGMRVSAETSKRLAVVWACLEARGRIPATMPCKIYKDLPGGGKKLLRKHPVYSLVATAPNSIQTPFEWFQMMQGHVDLRGNGYNKKLFGRTDAYPRELMPMHPDHVRVEIIEATGKLKYIYSNPLTKRDEVLVQEEVFHLRNNCDVTGIGQSRISAGRDTLGVGLALQDYHAKFLKNDATPNIVVTGTNFKTKQDENQYREEWQKSGTGENRHKIKLLPPGIDVKALGVSLADMQAMDAEKASDVRICTWMGVLPHIVGVDAGKSATYASVEQFNIMHAVQCGLPICVNWEQAIERDLIGYDDDEGAFSKFSMAALLRGDQATRYAAYQVAVANGWMSQDDVRELEDMNPIPNGWGKNYWRQLNWAPLQQIANPEPKPPATPAAPDDDDDDDEDETGSGGDGQAAAAMEAQLQAMASGSAQRCVRKEVGFARKLVERQASAPEVAQKYSEHHRFIAEVFQFDATVSLNALRDLTARGQTLAKLIGDENPVAANALIEQIAQNEPLKLAKLAVEGVK
jgi:HK97 family phage portal protein